MHGAGARSVVVIVMLEEIRLVTASTPVGTPKPLSQVLVRPSSSGLAATTYSILTDTDLLVSYIRQKVRLR